MHPPSGLVRLLRSFLHLCLGCLLLLPLVGGRSTFIPAADPAAAPGFDMDVKPLLEKHCFACHGSAKVKGGINLEAIARDKPGKHRKTWRKVLAQLEAKEMPPVKQPQLSDDQREKVLAWLKDATRVDCTNLAERDPGQVPLRRLNRTEYNRTIHDLVGIDFDGRSAVGLPDDASVSGFDNLATSLTLSTALMEKYLLAADHVLARVLGPADATTMAPKMNPNETKQAEKARQALLFVKPGPDLKARDAARKILERFAARAYRRPLEEAELQRMLKGFDAATDRGASFENALRIVFKAVLVSPNFLLRVEEDRAPEKQEKSLRISNHELAVRLSYFLWSTMPDAPLLDLAQQKKLHEPVVLEAQVKRMLADPKARALTDNFGVQWLQLRKLDQARPSTEYFPTFNHSLRVAMTQEAVTFFDKLREEDRPVLDMLDSDYTYVNEPLAKHYGIADVKGPQMRKVQLKPEHHRGGLLGMAGILTMTSHTSRTSPTLRGKYVLDVMLGTPPPPPPPDAGMIDETKQKGQPKSFRELLAQHAGNATCAACHKKMDPLGFALDNYDAIGRWRDDQGGRPLDVTGELPGGEKLTGPVDLKKIVRNRQDQFVRNMAEQMLVYALARELVPDDECTVRDLTNALSKNDHRFAVLVQEIVKSFPFQHRRARGARFDD